MSYQARKRRSFGAKDPRELIHYSGRIPREAREKFRQQAQRLKTSASEIHRQAIALGLERIEQIDPAVTSGASPAA